MLDSNSAFFRALTRLGFETTSYSTCINIYSGTVPTDEFIEQNVTGNLYDVKAITDSLPAESVLLGNLAFENSIVSEYEGNDHFVIPLSDSIREIAVKATGVATWFMLYSSNKLTNPDPSLETSINAYQIIIGTVGDIGSGADLELPESSLDLNKDYKCNDIVVSLI